MCLDEQYVYLCIAISYILKFLLLDAAFMTLMYTFFF